MLRQLTFTLLFFPLTLLSFNPTNAMAENDCATLITERCETCHYKTRICQKLGEKSKSAWKRTVKNMVSYGAQLNKDEINSLITCLDSRHKSVVSLCEKD
jgi:hypothetical protein